MGAVEPVRDFDRSSAQKFVQESDKNAGELVWSLMVPEDREGRAYEGAIAHATGTEAEEDQVKIEGPGPGTPALRRLPGQVVTLGDTSCQWSR